MRDRGLRIPFAVGFLFVVAGLYYYYAWSASHLLGSYEPTRTAFIVNILLGIPLSAVVCLTVMPAWLRRWDSRLGDLSYGIYLNHFLVAGLLLWLAEIVGRDVFGSYNHPGFGISALIASSIFAALTFNLVERPVEILRRKIKSDRNIEAAPAPRLATQPAGAPPTQAPSLTRAAGS